MVRSYLLSIKDLPYVKPYTVVRGMVRCHVNFTRLHRISTEDVRAALNAVDVRYANDNWSLREILDSEVDLGYVKTPAVKMKLEFTTL